MRTVQHDGLRIRMVEYSAGYLADLYTRGQASLDAVDKMSAESNTAIALAPNSLEAHRARGYILFVTGNYGESVREYKQALSINDNIADVHLLLGLLYRAMASDPNSTDPTSKWSSPLLVACSASQRMPQKPTGSAAHRHRKPGALGGGISP